MIPILPKNDLIDELHLYKYDAMNKMRQIMSLVKKNKSGGMIRTASGTQIDKNTLVNLFTQMLSTLNMTANSSDVKDIINKIAKESDNIDKKASTIKNSEERRDDIKIVSKSIKDSHYQVDLSKDIIKQDGKEIFMVSCYARDAYLGRYLIKRNFFYTMDREKFADSAYDEILTKIGAIKDRYYNEIIDVSAIFTQIKQILDGVISEIESKEDHISTNINR